MTTKRLPVAADLATSSFDLAASLLGRDVRGCTLIVADTPGQRAAALPFHLKFGCGVLTLPAALLRAPDAWALRNDDDHADIVWSGHEP